MSHVSISEYFIAAARKGYVKASLDLLPGANAIVDPDALFERMEQMNARRNNIRPLALRPASQHPDAQLFSDRDAFDAAWQREINARITQKRLGTPEAAAIARAAREATAALVRQIEQTCPRTKEGLEAKARTALWRSYSEPAGSDNPAG